MPDRYRRLLLPLMLFLVTAIHAEDTSDSEIDAKPATEKPASNEVVPGGISPAFAPSWQENLPMSPAEIRLWREILEGKSEATYEIHTPDAITSKSIPVNISPGAVSPNIQLLPGHVLALEVLDRHGSPWGILSAISGNPELFQVIAHELELEVSNIITITPKTQHGKGNLVLLLRDRNIPITINLSSEPKPDVYHDRIALLINATGSSSPLPGALNDTDISASSHLMDVLDGIRPVGANAILLPETYRNDIQGWRLDDKLFLRGRFVLLSPGFAPNNHVGGSGGVRAYEIPFVSRVWVALESGVRAHIKLTEADDE